MPPTDRNDHRCALPNYHHTVKHAIGLLKWWATDESDDPRVVEAIKQSRECARELRRAIRSCERSHGGKRKANGND